MNRIAVIGIGNPYRGDDAAGALVVDELKKTITSGINFFKVQGDMTVLIEHLTNFQTVFLIDACESGAFDEDWLRIDALKEEIPIDRPQTSTHGFSVSQAIEMAKNFGRLPGKLILYAIQGSRFEMSHAISQPVAKAVEVVSKEILNEEEVRLCQSKA